MANFGFTNLKEFGRQLDNFKKQAEKKIKDELLFAGVNIEKDARANAPVRTGHLKAGYHINKENLNKYEVSVETNVEYAPYVELGTEKQVAQPHLEPALRLHQGQFFAKLENRLKESWKNS